MNVILLDRHEVTGDAAAVGGARARHIREVLRAAAGDRVRIGVIDGALGVGLVSAVTPDRVELTCRWDADVVAEPRVDLLLALPRPKVLKRLFAQIAALGVGRIILTNAARVERDYFDTHVLTAACYRPLLIEGLQQARDTRLPTVSIHRQFKVLIEDELANLSPNARRIVTHPGDHASLHSLCVGTEGRILIAIGPEGGWNAFELALLETAGFTRAGMGSRPLRSDTACIAILALAIDALRTPAG